MGYKFQFVTLAGFHASTSACSSWRRDYRSRGMAAYSELQQAEFAAEDRATPPPATSARWAPATSTPWRWRSPAARLDRALEESTEAEQFDRGTGPKERETVAA